MSFITRQGWCLALLLAVVTVVGCSASKSDKRLDGTWVGVVDGNDVEYRFKNGTFESFLSGGSEGKGTYTADNGTLTMDQTHIFGSVYNTYFSKMGLRDVNLESKWYSSTEFVVELKSILLNSGVGTKQVDDLIYSLMTMPPATYTVDDKNLVIAFNFESGNHVVTLTKK
jgi:hypothetical protein